MILESQHPESLQQIQHLEDASRYQRREWIEEVVKVRSSFTFSTILSESLWQGCMLQQNVRAICNFYSYIVGSG